MPRSMLCACALLMLVVRAATAGAAPPGQRRTWWGATQLPEQWRRSVPESAALAVPTPITRDDQIERVTLKDAIALALENNPGIAAQRLEPGLQAEGILAAQAQFDPILAGEVMQSHSTTPNASVLAGTRTLNIDDRTANFHLVKTLRTSTLLTFDALNERLDNNAKFNQLRPQYTPELNFSIIQPLLRNFGWDFSYLVVRVAEQTADAAVFTYQATLTDFVQQVIEAYWGVVGARENVEVQRESKALADRTVEENQARVRVGLLAPVAVLEAQADAASRESDVIVAENALVVARQRLAQLAYYRPADTFVPRTLEPTDEANPDQSVETDLDRDLGTALSERPEIQASARGVKVQVLNERIAGNALLPRLDLVGSYGVNGTSGSTRPIVSSTNLGASNCVPNPATPGTFLCNSPFGGPASDAYDRLVTNDFRSYSFGLQLQVPLSNAAARAQYSQSRIARSQAELGHRELLSQITLEVRQSVADVLDSRKAIESTRVARQLAEENLRNQEKRHEVGMATTKDLLDFQTRLTTARAAEVQAKIVHMISVARWRRAQGELLQYYQVVLDQPGRHSPPWFARF